MSIFNLNALKTRLLRYLFALTLIFSAFIKNAQGQTITCVNNTGFTTSSTLRSGMSATTVYGVSMTVSASLTLGTMQLTSSNANANAYFANGKLYMSTAGTRASATAVSGASVAINGTDITITGFSQAMNTGTTYTFYLDVDVNIQSYATLPSTEKFSISFLKGPGYYPDYVASGTAGGTNYTLSGPDITVTKLTTGLTASPISYGQTGIVIFGFSVTVTGALTINQFDLTVTGAVGSILGNCKLYRSTTSSTYPTGFSPASGSINTNNSPLQIPLTTAEVFPGAATTVNYYLVADYTGTCPSSTSFNFGISTATGSSAFAIGPASAYYPASNAISSDTYAVAYKLNWIGGNSSSWSDLGNFSVLCGGAPSAINPNDIIQVGVVAYSRQPTINTATSFGQLIIGTLKNSTGTASYPTITVSAPMTLTGDITQQNTWSASSGFNVTTITGASTINAVNLNIGDGSTPSLTGSASAGVYLGMTGTMTLSGNINVISAVNGGSGIGPGAVIVGSGTVTAAGITTTNASASGTSTFFMDATSLGLAGTGILNLTGSTPFSLSSTGTNNFNMGGGGGGSTNATVNFSGSGNQSIRLNLPSGAGTAYYDNIGFSGSGTKSFSTAGTLKVDNDLVTSGTAILDLTVNNPTVNITGNLTNGSTATIKQGSNPVTIGGTFGNAGTFTGGSGAITSTGLITLTGGTLTTGSGTFTASGGLTNSGGTFQGGAGNVVITGALQNTTGTFNSVTNPGTLSVSGNFINGATYNGGTGTTDFNGTTFTNTGVIALGTGGTTIAATTFSNGSAATFTGGTGILNFDGTAAQGLTNSNTTTAIAFKNVTFSGNTTKTLTGPGLFNVASTGTLNVSGASTVLAAGTSLLTLQSNAASTASIGVLPAAGSITGTVTAERYVSGVRGYRLFSSPVSTTTVYTLKGFTLSGIKTGTIISGPGTGGSLGLTTPNTNGFDVSSTTIIPNNPSAFVYKESDVDPTSKSITSSDYKGFASTSQAVPMGTGLLIFYRGNRSLAQAGDNSGNVFTSVYPTALSSTLKFSGTITGGTVTAYTPTFSGSPTYFNSGTTSATPSNGTTVTGFGSTMSYTSHSSPNDGFNLLGNPFPSTIDLEALTFGSGIGSTVYTLNSSAQSFGTYVRSGSTSTDGVALNGASRYVLSGEGFFVKALSTGTKTVSIPEAAKTSYPSGNLTSTGTPSAIPTVFSLANKNAAIRIRLVQDSVLYNESVISFNSQNVNNFEEGVDVSYLSAPSQPVFMYSFTDDGAAVVFNRMNALENIKTIKLYAEGSVSGTYLMQFAGANTIDSHYVVYLKDAFTHDSVNIATTPVYTYTIDRGNAATFGAARFTLVVHKDTDGKYQLLTFSGARIIKSIKLTWVTKNESDVMTWEVQRSIDGGKTYVTLGTVQSKSLGTYSFTDNSPVLGTDIYRLKQSDVNDDVTYTDLVSFTFDGTTAAIANTITMYPNPAVAKVSIDFSQKITNPLQINIVSSSGKTVKQLSANAAQHIDADVSALQTGIYIVEIYDSVTNQKLSSSKLIKN